MMKKVLSRKMGKLEHLGTLLLVSYMPMVENKELMMNKGTLFLRLSCCLSCVKAGSAYKAWIHQRLILVNCSRYRE